MSKFSMKNTHTFADSDSDEDVPIRMVRRTTNDETKSQSEDMKVASAEEGGYSFKSKKETKKESKGFEIKTNDFPALGNNITKKKKDIVDSVAKTSSTSCWSGVKTETVHEEFDTKVIAKSIMPPLYKKKNNKNTQINKETFIDDMYEYWDESDDEDYELNSNIGIEKYDHH